MLKLLNVSARPSFLKLRLFQSSLSHSLVVKCKLSSVTCSLICGNSVLKSPVERVGWDCQGICLQGWAIPCEDRYCTLLLGEPQQPVILNTWLKSDPLRRSEGKGRGSFFKL